ncbi:porin family protein [Massilia arenosa]|uniref:Porin family protein n=1 Tax=Zemynaea arenosa TaxID=2561931 RepID=A0A4Y9SI61_9BURK|nr:porin family protein [Massilia arenosa]TFW20282.1 porin family protein [Massilia arenosa]
MKKLILALIAGAAALSASAQTTSPKAYVGVGVNFADRNYASPAGATNLDDDGYRASGKIFGGYEFDNMWGMEAGYTDFRKSNSSYTLNGTRSSVSNDGHAWYLAAKATAPVNDQFNVFGKLGVTQVKYNQGLVSDDKTGAYAALGAEYKVNQNVSFTAEYERYGKSNDFGPKPNTWTLAAKYSF